VLTPRNFIGVTIAIAVFSIISLCWSMLQPPDGGGMRADSYGTRSIGHRAIYEAFEEIGVTVHRQLRPPKPTELADSVLVLWDPRIQLINADPKWLRDVEPWLQQGGQAVVAFDDEPPVSVFAMMQRQRAAERERDKPEQADDGNDDDDEPTKLPKPSLFELLGIGKLEITIVGDPETAEDLQTPAQDTSRNKRNELPSESELTDAIREAITASSQLEKPERHTIKATGVFAESIPAGSHIELPVGLLYEINVDGRELADAIYVVDDSGSEHCIAARFPVGKGHVTVVSIRRLISNVNIGSEDNILVAAALMLNGDRSIVFDEFYHGATIRGNPMWLLSTKTYGSIAVSLLALLAFAVWRASVFLGPPVEESSAKRRSIAEYLDAMSRFLREAKGHGDWTLEQVRDGVLWKLRREFGLPLESQDHARLTAAMARKDPRRADKLNEVLNEVNAVLHKPRSAGERSIAQLVQRMTECLSKTDTARSAPKSPK
jgi:hypothetical protein